MTAIVIKEVDLIGKRKTLKVGHVLDTDEDGVYFEGEWLCDLESPFAHEHFKIQTHDTKTSKTKEN